MDDINVTLDAIGRLANLINNSNDIELKNDINSKVNKIDTNNDKNSTMSIAMKVLKTQTNTTNTSTKLVDLDTIDSSITNCQLDFEKKLYCQLLSNTRDVFITHLKHILNDITNTKNTNTILRATNILNVISHQVDYDFKGNTVIYKYY